MAKSPYKKVNITTPICTFVYPKIDRVDEMNGDYRTLAAFGPEETAEIVAAIDGVLEATFGEASLTSPMTTRPLGKQPKTWNGAENLEFMLAKSKFRPAVFDAQGRACPEGMAVPAHTKGRLRIDLVPYEMNGKVGVSARLLSVQIVKLGEAYNTGFDAIEGVDDAFQVSEDEFDDVVAGAIQDSADASTDFDFG